MLLLLALCSLSLLQPVQPSCPSGYTAAPNLTTCLSGSVATDVNYCQCLKTCAQLGQRILQPDTYAAVRLSLGEVWTGINDQLVERGSSPTGWQVVPNRAGSLLTLTDLWNTGQPDGTSIEDCVNHNPTTKKLHDAGCTATIACRCEHPMGDERPVPAHYELFVESPVVDFTQGAVGCTEKIALELPIELLCAGECREKLGCVGFYFNPLRRECVLLLYMDAAVSLSYSSPAEQAAWIKKIAVHM
uniref:C-type lectin domain-containing protein n=1 Tax=Macrostomum lignano TaxID=282301 RepID=A0A1I8J9T8_9PLAT